MGSETAPWRTIVGVVGDVRHYRLEDAPNPQLYVPEAQWASSYMNLVVRTRGETAAVIDAARQEIWAVDRGIPVPGVATLDEVIARHTAQRRFVLSLLSTFATVALLLAMVGIYGLLAYHVAQRANEIGVRVALGAQRSDVFRLIVREGMSLTLVGAALGLLGALGLTRYLSSMLFGVEPTDPLTLLGVAGLTAAVAFVACSLPARRATRVDAPVVLSTE
jgi:putative ABC transport system permease protein